MADMVSVLIHGVLKSIEIGGNPCEGGKKASILADAILIKLLLGYIVQNDRGGWCGTGARVRVIVCVCVCRDMSLNNESTSLFSHPIYNKDFKCETY